MKRITFKLPYDHTGVAEIDKDEVILYIEKPRTILWGLIDWPKQVDEPQLFLLRKKDCDEPPQLRLSSLLQTWVSARKVNIDTFSPLHELEMMFETYHQNKLRADAWDKRVETWVNKI